MRLPKVSVIIPVYNGEKTLEQCLSSVLNQTYKNYEVIIVDNNSTDQTKNIIGEFQKKDKRIVGLLELQRGRGAARNTGEKKAKGEIILMTDSDCIVPKNWVRGLLNAIAGYDAAQGFEESAFNNYWGRYCQVNSEANHKKANLKSLIGKIDTKNFAIKKGFLKKIGFTSRKYFSGNDLEISIRLEKNNCKIRFAREIKVRHFHPCSLKEIFTKQACRAKWSVIISKDHQEFLKSSEFLKDTNQTLCTFIIFFPGLFGALIRKGPACAFFDLVTGVSWRVGLIKGWLEK